MKAPTLDIDFYGEAALTNPSVAYHKMLRAGPVVFLEPQQMHAICGFDAVTQVLRDHRCFKSGKGVSINEEVNQFLIGSTLNSDRPAHDESRAITFAPLTPKALSEVRAKITAEAVQIAEAMVTKGTFDGAADLAPHLPLTIVRDLVGLGAGGKDHMLDWGAATFELMGDARDRVASAKDRMGQLRRFLDDPGTMDGLTPDGWADRATGKGLEAGMSAAKAKTLMRDYIAPSLDTTISAIGYAIHLFATNPDQWTKLRVERGLIKNAIEEVVRLNTPIRAFSRWVAEDVSIAGVDLAEGERVLVVYGAANRDPAKFPDPDRFDITRETRGHLGFGHGVHACLGLHLARLEMACLFEALADRIETFEPLAPPTPGVNATIHSYAKVPVRAIAA